MNRSIALLSFISEIGSSVICHPDKITCIVTSDKIQDGTGILLGDIFYVIAKDKIEQIIFDWKLALIQNLENK